MANIYAASQIPEIVTGYDQRKHPRRGARWQFEGFDKNKKKAIGNNR